MISLNSYRFSPVQNRNSVNFTGDNEDVDKIVKIATSSYNPFQIDDEIDNLDTVYLKKVPKKVESALESIITFHKNPNNPLRCGSEDIIEKCTAILKKIKKT